MGKKREERKHAHIKYAANMEEGPLPSGWDDIFLVHQALLKNDINEISTEVKMFGKILKQPLIINAMTGGAPGLEKLNASLARIANEAGIAMAVGSQASGLKNRELQYTYDTVRKFNPNGLIMANVSALSNPKDAVEAIKMIGADALQIHLNGAQELIMTEGDRNFKGMAENIKRIVETVEVPCVAKEVGFGISKETAQKLYDIGIDYIDVSGAGGTNFAAIELSRRHQNQAMDYMRFWGITAVCSLLEVRSLGLPIGIISSGGITNAMDLIKALSLGAKAGAIAGEFLKTLVHKGEEKLLTKIINMQEELSIIMMMLGCERVSEISNVPKVLAGFTKTWCDQRNISHTI